MSGVEMIEMNNLISPWQRAAGRFTPAGRERGAALILVMVILVMLTFIGLAALSTSSTELFLSSNYRRSLEAYRAAEGRMGALLIETDNFIKPSGWGSGSYQDLNTVTDTNPTNQGVVTSDARVTYTGEGPPPAGSGMGTKVKANYWVVDTTGHGSLGATNRQELVLSRIVPGGTQ